MLIHGFSSNAELNWERAGWVRFLTGLDRRLILVDLPGHGTNASVSAAGSDATGDTAERGEPNPYRPSAIRRQLAAIARAEGVSARAPMDIIAYSFGTRLTLELIQEHPELIRRAVLGGPGTTDHLGDVNLAAACAFTRDRTPIDDPATAALMHMADKTPGANLERMLDLIEAVQQERFVLDPTAITVPVALVVGREDRLVGEAHELAELTGAPLTVVEGRNHVNAVTARAFKDAAADFLGDLPQAD